MTASTDHAEAGRTRPETVLRVVKGDPTDAEAAALLVVLLALRGAQDEGQARGREGWGSPQRALRQLAPANRVAHPWRRG